MTQQACIKTLQRTNQIVRQNNLNTHLIRKENLNELLSHYGKTKPWPRSRSLWLWCILVYFTLCYNLKSIFTLISLPMMTKRTAGHLTSPLQMFCCWSRCRALVHRSLWMLVWSSGGHVQLVDMTVPRLCNTARRHRSFDGQPPSLLS